MKINNRNLSLALALGLASSAATLAFTGCASAPQNVGLGNVPDGTIADQVRLALKDNPDYNFNNVQVSSTNGVVILTGTADNDWLKVDATSVTLKVNGVRTVFNRIIVPAKDVSRDAGG